MLRRWTYRSLFLLLALLSAASWVASCYRVGYFGCSYGAYAFSLNTYYGVLRVGLAYNTANANRIEWDSAQLTERFALWPTFSDFSLGFGFTPDPDTGLGTLQLPYWFLLLLFTLLLIITWHKTRPKLNSKTAFPIEVPQSPPPPAARADEPLAIKNSISPPPR